MVGDRNDGGLINIWCTNADVFTVDKHLELIALLNNSEIAPDLIAITEVKPKHSRFPWSKPMYKIDGYQMETHNTETDHGRGMMIYVRDGLCYNVIDPDTFTEANEAQFISLELTDGEKLLYGSTYRSPNSSEENDQKFNQMMKDASGANFDHIILTGDLNYPNINWELMTNNTQVQDKAYRFIETVRDCYLNQHVDRPTRGRGTDRPSLLDLILTDITSPTPEIQYESPLGKSDHCLLKLSINYQVQYKTHSKTRRNYARGNYERLRQKLSIDWTRELDQMDNVDDMWENIKRRIMEAERDCIPDMRIHRGRRKHAAPLDKKIRTKIKRKKRLWLRYTQTRDVDVYREYCQTRNQVRKLTRDNKKNHEKHIASQVSANPKKFWSYVNQRTSVREAIPKLSRSGDPKNEDIVEDNREKAEVLATSFSSVFTREPEGDWLLPGSHPIIDEVFDASVDRTLELLKDIDPTKSPGPDEISPRLLHEARDELAPALSALFNRSIATGRIPREWKWANITPIYKKGDKRVALNYRPVSLTSVTCKLLEKVIRRGIVDHMTRHEMISKQQFGFLAGRSTLLQLLIVLEHWTRALEEGDEVDVVFMDFRKAFDKVPHRRLGNVLRHYGISGNILHWIEDFLRERQQRVRISDSTSEWRHVLSGIPQGSVLGPILFVIYVNSLPTVARNSEVFLFADDTKVFKQIKSADDAPKLQEDINRMLDWTKDSLLEFHPEKCKSMTIARRTGTVRDYEIAGRLLERVTTEKDLGVILDCKLTFEEHMWSKIKKANSIMGIIRRSFTYLDETTFLHLYKSLVRPHLEYGNQAWCPHLRKHIDSIENVQRRATKLIPGFRDLSYPERLQRLKLPTLAYRRLRGDLIETFKLATGRYDMATCQDLLTINPRTSRGHRYKLTKDQVNTNLRKFSFTQRIINPWNSLPACVVEAPSVESFERRLDKHYSNLAMRFDHHTRTDQF